MKRWIRLAAWLYPAEWRARYGAEFEVFLGDAPLRWRDLADVMRGAAIMQMTSWMTYWKMALLAGLAGAILAGGIAFTIPNQYVSTAALMIERPDSTRDQVQRALMEAELKLLGHDSLIEMIRDPRLDLYKKELQRFPIDEVAESIFRKHLHVAPYSSFGITGQAFRVVFSDPDRHRAVAVVERLTGRFHQELYHAPDGQTLSILEPPILPERPVSPVRSAFAILGASGGSLLGLLSLALFRRTRTYAVVTMSIPKDTKKFVDRQIAAGQYRNVSDYVRELIRADEERRK